MACIPIQSIIPLKFISREHVCTSKTLYYMCMISACRIKYQSCMEVPIHTVSTLSHQKIEENWKELNRWRDNLFNAKLLRVYSREVEQGVLTVSVVPNVFYKDVVSLRFLGGYNPAVVPRDDVFQVLSCYIVLRDGNGDFFFMKRDSGDWQPALDFSGGFIQASMEIQDGVEFAEERVCRDLNLDKSHISSVGCLGYVDYPEILEYMLVYLVDFTDDVSILEKESGKKLYKIPVGYTKEHHSDFFDLRIHGPLGTLIDDFMFRASQLNK